MPKTETKGATKRFMDNKGTEWDVLRKERTSDGQGGYTESTSVNETINGEIVDGSTTTASEMLAGGKEIAVGQDVFVGKTDADVKKGDKLDDGSIKYEVVEITNIRSESPVGAIVEEVQEDA